MYSIPIWLLVYLYIFCIVFLLYYIHLHHIPAHYRWDRGESVLCTYVPCCVLYSSSSL